MAEPLKPRPEFRNIHVSDLSNYRLPPAGIVSILHRISGVILFFMLPFIVWLFDVSLTSEITFEKLAVAYNSGLGVLPGWFVKLMTLGILWGYFHHFIAGVRHLWMDATHSVSKAQGHSSAVFTLAAGTLLTAVCGAKLFGLF